jgi:cytochrome b subunit of formate dehydrogenase
MSEVKTYPRFSLAHRAEHLLLLVSFTTLALTGLPQKYAAAPLSDWFIGLLGGIENVRLVHHYAAIVLMLETVYHLAVVLYRVGVRRVRLTMLPTLRDGLDAWQAFTYNLGFGQQPPQMGRYTFEEKAEYWALLWGTVVMIITGFMMWNPIATTRFVPGQFIPAAKAAHGGEALLAVLAIIVWHMYGVHLKRFNTAMWTGRQTEAEMAHEHPLELADIKAGLAEHPVEPPVLRRRQLLFYPLAGVLSAALLGGVYFFVTFEQTAITTLPAQNLPPAYVPQTPTARPPTATPAPAPANLTWDGYVGPLLKQKCSACHGVVMGLTLTSYAEALKGSQNGPVIIPGNATGSPLIIKQSAGNHPGQLSGDELAQIKAWIDAGAAEK